MKKALLWIPSAAALALSLSNCTNTGPTGTAGRSVGPFDAQGRYREDWADDPSKWRATGGTPQVAKNDYVPANSVPLPPANNSRSKPIVTAPPVVVRDPGPVVKTTPKPTVKEATTPTHKVVAKNDDEDEPMAKPKPKPKTTTVKAKPKPKPKVVRYTVKKGDSLSSIASKTGSSVAAIKAENGISGTLIRDGQSLVIPKR